jgi:hypothetical protein
MFRRRVPCIVLTQTALTYRFGVEDYLRIIPEFEER